MNINNSYDIHLDPPEDDIEGQDCEFCGQPMEYHCDRLDKRTKDEWWKCNNQFCPAQFSEDRDYSGNVVKDMAELLAEVEQELKNAGFDLKYANARITNLKTRLGRLEKLTQSQPSIAGSIAVRDTEYQIQRMQDCIEYAYIDCEGYRGLKLEWNEVVKILRQF